MTRKAKNPKHAPKRLSLEEKVERLVEKAGRSASNTGSGNAVVLSVQDFEARIKTTRIELEKLEAKRDQAELSMGTMLSNGASEKESDDALAKINKLEVSIRKIRATEHGYLARMGSQKREEDAYEIRKVAFIEQYGCSGEERLCDKIDAAIVNLSQTCHELKRWKELVDYSRYSCTGARARPEHIGYAVAQRLVGADMNRFLHLGVKNHSFLKDSLFETLHPSLKTANDAIPPLQTQESQEQLLAELIAVKRAEVEKSVVLDDPELAAQLKEQERQQQEDQQIISEVHEPLPEGAELQCKQLKIEEN